MLITLSRRTAICQSVAEVQLTGVAPLGVISHRLFLLRTFLQCSTYPSSQINFAPSHLQIFFCEVFASHASSYSIRSLSPRLLLSLPVIDIPLQYHFGVLLLLILIKCPIRLNFLPSLILITLCWRLIISPAIKHVSLIMYNVELVDLITPSNRTHNISELNLF